MAHMSQSKPSQSRPFDFGFRPFLWQLTDDARDAFLEAGRVKYFSDGQFVFSRGSEADITVVLKGAVRVETTDAAGRTTTLSSFDAGQIFGEAPALSRKNHICDGFAIGNTAIHELSLDAFEAICDDFPDIMRILLASTADRLMASITGLDDVRRFPVIERIGRLALRVGAPASKKANAPVTLHISQSELASITGTSRATVVRQLSRLRSLKLVETHYSELVVPNPDRLASWLEKARMRRG